MHHLVCITYLQVGDTYKLDIRIQKQVEIQNSNNSTVT